MIQLHLLDAIFLFVRMKSSLSGPLTQYRNQVQQGKLQHDPYQETVALELEKLLGRLDQYEKDMEEYHVWFGILAF